MDGGTPTPEHDRRGLDAGEGMIGEGMRVCDLLLVVCGPAEHHPQFGVGWG